MVDIYNNALTEDICHTTVTCGHISTAFLWTDTRMSVLDAHVVANLFRGTYLYYIGKTVFLLHFLLDEKGEI